MQILKITLYLCRFTCRLIKKTRELNGLEGQHPIDLAATGSGAGTFSGVGSLSFEELLLLNERKEALKKDYAAYVESHPEIKTLLSWFMSALLLEKPQDVVAFAADHFSAFQPPHAGLPPIVIAGPSGVGKGMLINLLLEKFLDTIGFSVSHTTRGPREGEVDGVANHFTQKDQVLKEIGPACSSSTQWCTATCFGRTCCRRARSASWTSTSRACSKSRRRA
ncbi:hypothetical protein PR003_g23831 [Phytophthora rubi]|uniref:Guanylate kinase-like domain-containing protein n=1 Tax=Phytophthora rubi TaxID=129364 RepID=A0A6A4CVY1_9STRA|nr:hypothetical protein PR002_g22198 [Phytophthora rubi]KAE9296141.1 hypothetical protein PR003_g23831 [Phytophthora rubi]